MNPIVLTAFLLRSGWAPRRSARGSPLWSSRWADPRYEPTMW